MKQDPFTELSDYLAGFGIGVTDSSKPGYMTIQLHVPTGVLIRGGSDFSNPLRVLLSTLKLLPGSFYEAKPFNRLDLWGRGTFQNIEKECGEFDPLTRELRVTRYAADIPFLGIAYSLLHEMGHSVEQDFPGLPMTLPPGYREQRDSCVTMHDQQSCDLLIYFAMAKPDDVQKWFAKLSGTNKERVENFRRAIFGDKSRLDQQKALLDLIVELEQERSGIANRKWGEEFTREYAKTLGRLRAEYTP